jgi:RNA polymerase sigma-70 factor, ECF subfamily
MKIRFLTGKLLHEWTDEALVAAFQKTGNDAYFEVLFARYYPLVYGYCLGLTASREDSKDLTLVVFTKVYDQLARQDIQSFDRWLFTLARNESLSLMRSARRNALAQKKWSETQKSDAKFMENAVFRRLVYEQELEKDRLYQEGLQTLSPEQRLCLELFIHDTLSYREIAEQTQLSLEQVKSHLQNARRKLKQWVASQTDKKL